MRVGVHPWGPRYRSSPRGLTTGSAGAVRETAGMHEADETSSSLPETIVCVDCGGTCHRTSLPLDGGDETGDIVTYRCEDCHDRWDLIAGDPADLDDDGNSLLDDHRGHLH